MTEPLEDLIANTYAPEKRLAHAAWEVLMLEIVGKKRPGAQDEGTRG